MGPSVSLLVQSIVMGCIACTPLYFALPKPRTNLFPKLVAVFVVAQIVLSLVMPATGDAGKDWFQSLVGPMILAFLVGKYLIKRPTP